MHDPKIFKHPDYFSPDRFLKVRSRSEVELDPDILDPVDVAFGFGRRICPVRHFAYESLWLTIASLIAAFDIGKATDEQGNEITPTAEYEPGSFLRCLLL